MIIEKQTCFNHQDRPASAKCKQCGNIFCKECIVEYNGKLLCAFCLEKHKVENVKRPTVLTWILLFLFSTLSFFIVFALLLKFADILKPTRLLL